MTAGYLSETLEEAKARVLAEAAAEGMDLCPECFGVPRVNGVCNPCRVSKVWAAEPNWSAYGQAQARVDFGAWDPDESRPYTFADRTADELLVKRLESMFARAERDAKTPLNGCALCGKPERGHERFYDWPHRLGAPEGFVTPSDAVRKSRLTARRNVRHGLPAWTGSHLELAA